MINFKTEFGWSELIAVLALIISAFAFWQVSRLSSPSVEVHDRVPVRTLFLGEDSLKTHVAFPFTITNNGGRLVSLFKLGRDDLFPSAFLIEDGATVEEDPNLVVEYGLVEGIYNSAEAISELFYDTELSPLVPPQFLDVPIDSGAQKSFILLVSVEDLKKRDHFERFLTINIILHFTDGTQHKVAQAVMN